MPPEGVWVVHRYALCNTKPSLKISYVRPMIATVLTATIYGCPTTISNQNVYVVTHTPEQPIPPLSAYSGSSPFPKGKGELVAFRRQINISETKTNNP